MKMSRLLCLLGGAALASTAQALDPDSHPIARLAQLDDGIHLAAGAMATRAGTDSHYQCEQRMHCEVGGINADYAGSDRLAGTADFEGYVPYVGLQWAQATTGTAESNARLTRLGVAFTSTADVAGCRAACDRAPEQRHKDFDTAFGGASLRPMVRLDWAFRF